MRNYTDYKIERIINFCLGYLNISEVDIYVMYNETILNRFSSKDIEIEAILYKNPVKSSYNLYLRKNLNDIEKIICHEMIHLCQYERGELYLDFPTGIFHWKGNVYKNIPYFEREWEKEAFALDYKLYRKWRKFRKSDNG